MPTELTETMRGIRERQSRPWPRMIWRPEAPDTLLIACIDARINPKKIGIKNALIYRTISALVPPAGDPHNDMSEALAYAVKKGIRHIAILGHTRCGGLEACRDHKPGDHDLPHVHEHLTPIHDVRDAITGSTADRDIQIERLEEESVRRSLHNLMTYDVVKNAKPDLHGWVIDTVTQNIRAFDSEENAFRPMRYDHASPLPGEEPADTIEAVRSFKRRRLPDARENPYEHNPEMLIIGDLDANYNPAPYGKALIYRDLMKPESPISHGKKAALQFAIEVKKVKDIVVMGHTDNDLFADKTLAEQQQLNEELIKAQVDKLRHDPLVAPALAREEIALHGWLFDSKTKRISELQDGKFVPMGAEPDKPASLSL